MVAPLAQPIRVLVVDDSAVVREMLTALIATDPELRVAGTAANGREAIDLVGKLRPDIVTMDVSMPVLDGLEATKQIMAYHPTPILILSSGADQRDSRLNFDAMALGALDVMAKTPLVGRAASDFTSRLKRLSRVRVITHPLAKFQSRYERAPVAQAPSAAPGEQRIIAIASSTGGPQALARVLRGLPATLPCPVMIVQHISDGFDRGLAEWLNESCELTVKLAAHDEVLRAGTVYIAPNNSHLRIDNGGRAKLTDEPACENQKPSGTILFDSVAAQYGSRAVCAILTGMGRDGAEGLKRVKSAGGYVVAEAEETCVVFGMPKAAIELGIVDAVRPLDQIPAALLAALGHSRKEISR